MGSSDETLAALEVAKPIIQALAGVATGAAALIGLNAIISGML
ncbi:hypothetical protein [Rhodococcus sp. WS3]|nr:hypothetical protein [Rhodococcus sp. WS3]